MEEETEGQATRRQVLPNVTLDQQGVRNENLLPLRRSRRAARGNVTPGGDSHMEQTEMLVGNFEFNP